MAPDPRWTRRQLLAGTGAVVAGSYLFDLNSAPLASAAAPPDEDGYELWLRYRRVERPDLLASYRTALTHVVAPGDHPLLRSAADELRRGLSGLLGLDVREEPSPRRDGAIIVGTPESSSLVARHVDAAELERLGTDGYVLRRRRVNGHDAILVAGLGERGALYGAFHLLRHLQVHDPVARIEAAERPANPLRLFNHWYNLDRSAERGYAGRAIFDWDALPAVDQRYVDYARVLASIGINGTVVNNVNASAQFLASERLPGLAALAEVLREWGVTFYLSANYASPMQLGGLNTADPFDPGVRAWWKAKIDEIYGHIPDFGGFLVKANSEGQPGPLDYGRTHADGANLLGDLVAPHGGIVMWRSFVHEGFSDWAEYQHREFSPLDGDFSDNVVVQTKNGPIDFQVREPVNPLFGAMPHTNQMIELQITQEYTGQSTHLCYLVPQWKEVLDFDTHGEGPGTTVRRIVDGTAYGQTNVGFAGVANFGDDRNWTGHPLAAANAHGFGRLAWDPGLESRRIAEEWARMTFGPRDDLVQVVTGMLTSSWEIYESYTVPLGIGGHMVLPGGAHFDPNPRSSEGLSHHTDSTGTGFDRTVATGTGYTGLYHEPWASTYESLDTVPDELLLFMHWVPFTHVLRSGKTVIQHIYDSHFEGLDDADRLRRLWRLFGTHVDPRRRADVLEHFDRQIDHATLWRDSIVGYFFSHSRILDERRSWLQVDLGGASSLLFGGWPNRLPVEVGNATADDVVVRAAFVAPDDTWLASPTELTIGSTEFATMTLPVVPPLTARLETLDLDVQPAELPTLGATGREFVITPAGRRCVLALDAGTANSPLVRDYQRLTPGTAWDPSRGYGWVGTGGPQSRDRGGAFDALRRDFVNDIPARTLRIAVPPGRHEVSILVGDAGPDAEPTFVSIDGRRVAETPFLRGGTFTWAHIPVDGGPTGREVDLEFDSIPDQHWHLNALVMIDPDSELPALIVTDIDAELVLHSDRPAEFAVSVVNTTDADQTITVDIDAPDGWTADPTTHVIPAGAEQTVPVQVTPPPEPTLATLTITVTADGASVGDGTRRLDVVALPSGDQTVLALDAGGPQSPVIDGYLRLSPEDAWDEGRGYGWVGDVPEFRDRNRIDDVRRDVVFGRPPGHVLRVAVPPGTHTVHVLTGDAFAVGSETVVSVDGVVVGRSGESTIPQGTFRWFDFTLDGGTGGRTVDLELTGNLYEYFWRIVALVMV